VGFANFGFFQKFYMLVLPIDVRGAKCVAKIHLYIKPYKGGAKVDSVPVKQLIKLSAYRKRRWEFKDGWLILEAF